MEIVPLGPGFAAELRGVTLADIATNDAAYAAARAAFEEHSVLVFRGQEVTDDSQLEFSRRFGPPEVTKVGSLGTGTHFVILTTIGPDGKVVPADHRYAMRNKANQLWHTDSSFKSVPALTSILSARIIPDNGGETEFVSTRLALRPARSGAAQEARQLVRLASLRLFARQDRRRISPPARSSRRCRRNAGAWSGKIRSTAASALYLASHAYAVEGMEPAAGEKLIDELIASRHRAGHELRACLAGRRRRDVGQSRHHASRPALAGA